MTIKQQAVIEADELHQKLAAFLTANPGTHILIEVTACSYLLAGIAAEFIRGQEERAERQMGDRELDAVLDGVFDTMRHQVRKHLRHGMPTRK